MVSVTSTLILDVSHAIEVLVLGRFLRGIFSTNIWAVWVQNNCRKYSSKILFGKYGKRLINGSEIFFSVFDGGM